MTAPEGFPWLQAIVTSQPCWSDGACWAPWPQFPKERKFKLFSFS